MPVGTESASSAFEADRWSGSYYELSIDCGPAGDDRRVAALLGALWSLKELDGPWAWRDFREAVDFHGLAAFDESRALYGVAALDDAGGARVGCVTGLVREEGAGARDWLSLSIPTGMLSRLFRVEYPLWPRERNPWMRVVDQTLLRAAEAAYTAAPFDLAVITEEVGWMTHAEELTADQAAGGGYLVSPALRARLGATPHEPARLASGLLWFPYEH